MITLAPLGLIVKVSPVASPLTVRTPMSNVAEGAARAAGAAASSITTARRRARTTATLTRVGSARHASDPDRGVRRPRGDAARRPADPPAGRRRGADPRLARGDQLGRHAHPGERLHRPLRTAARAR